MRALVVRVWLAALLLGQPYHVLLAKQRYALGLSRNRLEWDAEAREERVTPEMQEQACNDFASRSREPLPVRLARIERRKFRTVHVHDAKLFVA